MVKFYNSRVIERRFFKGDQVMRKVIANTKDHADGAFGPKWEGPLVISET